LSKGVCKPKDLLPESRINKRAIKKITNPLAHTWRVLSSLPAPNI